MIVSCPACSARIRLDHQRLGGKRITLRCSRCREIFRIEIPNSRPAPQLKVLIAHGDPSLCATVQEILAREDITCCLCHDADSALLRLEAELPQVALIDVGLPGMFIFETIEEIRRRPSLARIPIILLSAVYNKAAYKRTPTSLYGADDYIEKHHLPDDLIPKIYRLTSQAVAAQRPGGKVVVGQPLEPGESGELNALCDEVNPRIKEAEELEGASRDTDERNRRIARMIAADIALYHQDKLEDGIRTGNVFALLEAEITEGERIFGERQATSGGSGSLVRQALEELVVRRRNELQRQASTR
ncbi:MAG: zinc-ribbon domain-containing protein [Desulfuromonadales bacterium]|nr:zinc-ribbon domain-containing protein [Desulfuromonadales bacterium]